MAKKTTTFCKTCGGPVGPGCDFCCHFCKLTARNDELLAKHKAKSTKKTRTKKPARKKARR